MIIRKYQNHGMLAGRPSFEEPKAVPINRSSLLEGKRFSHLKKGPGFSQILWKIIKIFVHAFIPKSLLNTEKTRLNPQALQTFSDSHSVKWYKSEAHQMQFISYFQRFLKCTENSSLSQQACFARLNTWMETLTRLLHLAGPNQKTSEIKTLWKKICTTITDLKSGEMCILPAHLDATDPLFYLFIKTGNTYTFKIIGRGEGMAQIVGSNQRAYAGKTAIQSEIAYCNIPADIIQDSAWIEMLILSPLIDQNPSPQKIQALTAHLHEYKDSNVADSSWVVKSNNPLKGLWSVARAMPMDDRKERSKNVQKRLQFEYQLYTLFEQFEACHRGLKVDSEDYKTLAFLHRKTSRQAAMAAKKGIIADDELEEIRQELLVVQQTLNEAKMQQSGKLSGISHIGTYLFPRARLSFDRDIQPPHPLPDNLPPPPPLPVVRVEKREMPLIKLPDYFTLSSEPLLLSMEVIQPDPSIIEKALATVAPKAATATYETKKIIQKEITASLIKELSSTLDQDIQRLKAAFKEIEEKSQDYPPHLVEQYLIDNSQVLLKEFSKPFHGIKIGEKDDPRLLMREALLKAAEEILRPVMQPIVSHLTKYLQTAVKECETMKQEGRPAACIEARILHAMQFLPLERRALNSLWCYLDGIHATSCMESLNKLSKTLLEINQSKSAPPPSFYIVMLKMSLFVYILSNRHINGIFSTYNFPSVAKLHTWTECLIGEDSEPRLSLTDNHGNITIYDRSERTGCQVVGSNLSLIHELQPDPFITFWDPSIDAFADSFIHGLCFEKYQHDLRFWYAQEEMLNSLFNYTRTLKEDFKYHRKQDSSGYDSKVPLIKRFFMPSQMNSWARSIHHPLLLAALRGIAMDDSLYYRVHIGGGFKIIQEAVRRDSLRTQEAFVDNPQGVFEHFADHLNQCIEYLQGADEPFQTEPHSFTKEELTDLLLLLRKKSPQLDILPFVEKHPTLLRQADIRNFLEMIFFDPSFIEAKKNYPDFFKDLPQYLANCIERYREKNLDLYIFLLEMNQHLARLGVSAERPEELANLTENVLESEKLPLYRQRALLLSLVSLLQQDQLSSDELATTIRYWNLYHAFPGNPQDIHPENLDFIQRRYALFMDSLEGVNSEPFVPILEAILEARGYRSSHAAWIGAFPRFSNGQVELDLLTGQLRYIEKGCIEYAKLPDDATTSPSFSTYFGDLSLEKINAAVYRTEEAAIYLFKDPSGHSCRIEKCDGRYHFYRTFPEIDEELQALPMNLFKPQPNPSDSSQTFFAKIKKALHFISQLMQPQNKQAHLPYILDRGVYVNPKKPGEGLCFDENGKLQFRIDMVSSKKGLEIRSVTDYRDSETGATGPWQVQSIETLQHPALDLLKKFESSDQIIVWGKKGRIHKIEMPRYGMTFQLQNDALILLNSKLKGYQLNLGASITDRKGYAFSLLLQHSDREKPAYLILPSSAAIQPGESLHPHQRPEQQQNMSESFTQMLLQVVVTCCFPFIKFLQIPMALLGGAFAFRKHRQKILPPGAYLSPHIRSQEKQLHPTIFTIRAHTGELIPAKENRIPSTFEQISQALKIKDDTLALKAFDQLHIDLEDLTRDTLKRMKAFLRDEHEGSGLEAALKIKLMLKLKTLMKADPKLQGFRKSLNPMIRNNTKSYLEAGRRVIEGGHLTDDERTAVSKLMRKHDREYYELHMRPFFLKENAAYVFRDLSYDSEQLPDQEGRKKTLDDSEKEEICLCSEKAEKALELTDFDYSVPELNVFHTHFLALYDHLLSQPLNSPFMQKIRWSFVIANAGKRIPSNAHELCIDALYTLYHARDQNVDLSALPTVPHYQKQNSSTYKEELEKVVESLFKGSKNCPLELVKEKVEFPPVPAVIQEDYFEPPPSASEREADEHLTDLHKDLKKRLAQQSEQRLIEELEEDIEPTQRLEKNQLSRNFTFVKDGESLLFTAEAMEPYFQQNPVILPKIEIPRPERPLTSCEKEAHEELEKELAAYRSRAEKKQCFSLNQKKMKRLAKTIREQAACYQDNVSTGTATLNQMMQTATLPLEHLEIMGGYRNMASLKELQIALYHKRLETLQQEGRIPSTLNLEELRHHLIIYFDAEVRLHLAEMCLMTLEKLQNDKNLTDQERTILSNTLYAFLTKKRHFSVEEDPLLLFYEAFRKITYRSINENIHQLEFLQWQLDHPTGISTAITGAGKTVMKLLEAMIKANGNNLVTMRFLDPLYPQSLALFQEILGDGFDRMVYPFRFNLKMPLKKNVVQKINDNNENFSALRQEQHKKTQVVQESVFKGIYYDMLRVISNKGCVVTDYKSLPLLAAKWIKLNREFIALQANGQPIPAIEQEHWEYLKKILILLKNKEVSAMDEYDRPNHSKKRLQLQIGDAVKPATFLWENALEIYDFLRKDPTLKLADNIQGELRPEVRAEALKRAAKHIAAKWNEEHRLCEDAVLVDYFLGKNEALLAIDRDSLSPNEWDTLALYKDLLSTYCPLALEKGAKEGYDRSEDGRRAIPSHEGIKQVNSRFGTVIEEYVYLIQDFIQNGVSLSQFNEWIQELKKNGETECIRTREERKPLDETVAGRQFKAFFPNLSLENTYEPEKLLAELNKNPEHVRQFLVSCLQSITVGASTVSFTPTNIVSLTRAVSGCSATTLGGLHRQFETAAATGKGTLGEMVYRLVQRTGIQAAPLSYDPENPLAMIEKAGPICAVIDGAGAFKDINPATVARELADKNAHIKRADFHGIDGKRNFTGEFDASQSECGFVYTQARSRGFDYALPSNGRAILTNNGKATLQELTQQDGRLRQEGQSVRLAVSQYAPISTTEDLIAKSLYCEAAAAAEHLYQAKEHELYDIIQTDALNTLLAYVSLDETLSRFQQLKGCFIQNPEQTYDEPGSYFAKHQHLHHQDTNPIDALLKTKEHLQKKARELRLETAVKELTSITYAEDGELVRKMPAKTFSPENPLQTGIELELEEEEDVELDADVEIQVDIEEEVETDLDKVVQFNDDLPLYLPWNPFSKSFQLASHIHPAFDPLLTFSENFLPITRTDPLFKRTPFDSKMNRLGTLWFLFGPLPSKDFFNGNALNKKLMEIRLCDSLDTVFPPIGSGLNVAAYKIRYEKGFAYDTRTNRVIKVYGGEEILAEVEGELASYVAQAKFFDGQYHDYDYTPSEWEALERWLSRNNPRALRSFFVKTILKSRQHELPAFEVSPLQHLFQRLINSK